MKNEISTMFYPDTSKEFAMILYYNSVLGIGHITDLILKYQIYYGMMEAEFMKLILDLNNECELSIWSNNRVCIKISKISGEFQIVIQEDVTNQLIESVAEVYRLTGDYIVVNYRN